MNKIFILLIILSIVSAQSNLAEKHQKEKDFLDLSKQHNKKYASTEETLYRFSIFKDNLKRLEEMRANHPNAQFELNQMFDLTQEEFMQLYNSLKPEQEEIQNEKPRNLESVRMLYTYPSSLDLRSNGGISSIRDQGQCGSCYAFSSVAAIEYAYWKKRSQKLDFSEQQLVDCGYSSSSIGGCIGGWMSDMYNYMKTKGLTLEQLYPYQQMQGTCKETSYPKYVYTATTPYVQVNSNDDSIKQALTDIGVLSACVDASNWIYYSSGIFSDSRYSSTTPLVNHGINIVGYGSTNGIPYYIIRNSWSTSWGESGYIRLDGRRYPNGNSYSGLSYQYTQYPIIN